MLRLIASMPLLLCGMALAEGDESPVFKAAHENQLGLAFSPDGSTAFWVEWNGRWGQENTSTKVILTSTRVDGVWSKPARVFPDGVNSDDDPFVSPDARWLYFVSDRPTSPGDSDQDTNIWRVSLDERRSPELVNVNSPGEEYSPVVTRPGALYFASDRPGGYGQGDIYKSNPEGDGFSEPASLGAAINSAEGEWNVWVAPGDDEMVFEASGRETNVSVPGDLYYSSSSEAGWTPAVPLSNLNTSGSELMLRPQPGTDNVIYTHATSGGNATLKFAAWQATRGAARAALGGTLAVTNRSSHEVTFLDLEQGIVTSRVATGNGPHLSSNVDEGRLLATAYGVYPEPHDEPVALRPPFVESLSSRATLIDVSIRKAVFDVKIPNCLRPHSSWIVNGYGYVTCEDEQALAKINLESGAVVDMLDTAQKGSHVLGALADGSKLAVSNTESDSVTLFDLETGDRTIVPTANGAEGLTFIGDELWISNALDGSVSVIDSGTGDVTHRIDDVCSFPIAMSRGVDGLVWVACFGSSELVGLGFDTKAEARRFKLDGQPLHVLAHPSLPLAYASIPRANAVMEVQLASGEATRLMDVGIEPDGLRWVD